MLRKVCPICGRETDVLIEGMCPDCYRATHRIVDTPESITVLRCRGCGAYFINGRWVKGVRSLERLVASKVKVRGVVEGMEVGVFRDRAKVKVKGKASELMPNSYEEEYEVKLMFQNDLCPSCRAELMEREEAIIQLRLIGGDPSDVKSKVMDIVRMVLSKGEDKGRIISVEDVDGGFDIKVTSQRLARSIALSIHRELPSFMMETSKVIGYRGDRRVEKRSISIHVFGLSKGEVVNINGTYYLVKSLHRDHVEFVRLNDGLQLNVKYGKLTQERISQVTDYSIQCGGGRVMVKVGDLQYVLSGVSLICP